ncbi:hypothetical protein HCB51_04260, partial [Listeria booriae]|nr:hypothetical protein [Listeria booriae]
MADRDAVDTIKGYFYQFDCFILQVLNLTKEEDRLTIEGIEDIDITKADETTAIQCKYYSKTEYNHSVIKPAIILMLQNYVATLHEEKKLKYIIYGHYKTG